MDPSVRHWLLIIMHIDHVIMANMRKPILDSVELRCSRNLGECEPMYAS